MRLLRTLFAAALLAATLPTMAAATTPAAPVRLHCEFLAEPRPDGQWVLRFKLTNTAQQDVYLLRWGSPFEGGWFGPFVQARSAQGDLPFQGAMRKRADPSAQDYLHLPATASLEAALPLNQAFALPTTGPLHLTARWHWHDVITHGTPPRPREHHQGLDQDCGALTLNR